MATTIVLIFITVATLAYVAFNPPLGEKEPPPAPPPADPPAPEPVAEGRDEWRSAVHEMGHATAHWFCTATRQVRAVVLDSNIPGYSAHVSFVFDGGSSAAHQWCLLVTDLAGVAAEMGILGGGRSGRWWVDLVAAREKLVALAGTKPPWNNPEPGSAHHVLVGAYRPHLTPDEARVFKMAFKKALGLVLQHRERLQRGAAHLVTHRTLTEKELEHVLGPRFMVRSLAALGPSFVSPEG